MTNKFKPDDKVRPLASYLFSGREVVTIRNSKKLFGRYYCTLQEDSEPYPIFSEKLFIKDTENESSQKN